MTLSNTKIDQTRQYFRDKPIRKAFLFGSSVTGKATSDSDIDILVELDYTKPIGLRFIRMQYELEELLQQKVDLLSDKAVSKYIRPEIDNQKQLIYER